MLFLQALVFTSTLWLPECQCSKPLFLDYPHVTHTVENKRGPELSLVPSLLAKPNLHFKAFFSAEFLITLIRAYQ